MTKSTASHGITRTSLALGSAVAIAGLVAALPAQAATTSNNCSGKSATAKSGDKMGSMKSAHPTMSKMKMKSSNGATCSGK
jgi:hypothetical protein